MATVADLSGNFPESLITGVDRKQNDPSRSGAGTPIALATVPAFAGEIVLNTLNGELWYAKGLTAADWTPYIVVA